MCISVKMHYILWEVGSPHHLNKSDLAVQRLSPIARRRIPHANEAFLALFLTDRQLVDRSSGADLRLFSFREIRLSVFLKEKLPLQFPGADSVL